MTTDSERILAMLGRATGLDLSTVAPGMLSRAVQSRMRALSVGDPGEYLNFLAANPAEMDELIELVVVPETWFFRDREPFELLRLHASAPWPGRDRGRPYTCLSAPCATGEETYSIAMALLAAGLDPGRVRVIGLDISRKALGAAEQGLYGPNSFRNSEPDFADRYFTPKPQGRQVAAQVKSCVSFSRANLALGRFGRDREEFDAVFCRNFLIYLDQETKRRLAEILHGLLRPGGLLFVGHAEMLPVFSKYFRPVRHPKSFAFVKGDPPPGLEANAASAPVRAPAGNARPEAKAEAPKPTAQARPRPPRAARPAKPAFQAPSAQAPGLLDQARELADRGDLARAEEACLRSIKEHGPCGNAFHLLGLVRDARGDEDGAMESFSKALYLQPDHEQCLAHLALLAEKRGDAKRAGSLRRRLAKLNRQGRMGA